MPRSMLVIHGGVPMPPCTNFVHSAHYAPNHHALGWG